MARGVGGRGEERMSGEYTFVRREEESGLEFLPSRILLGNKQLDYTSTTSPFLHSEYINYRQYFTSLQSWAQNRYFVTRYRYSLFVTR
jgi:hypothetical protein